jgi:tetratricopeptide (TPR) repeat protein
MIPELTMTTMITMKRKPVRLVFGLALALAVIACGEDKGNEKTMVLYGRAAAAYASGGFEETADLLEGCGNFAPALVLRSKALYFCGRGEDAEKLLRRVLRRHPELAEASLFLARIVREQGKDEEAQELAEQLLRNNPGDLQALRLASDLAAERGDGEDAAALLDRAVEASAETALVFVDRAKLRWTAGNRKGALEDLRRAELLLPWNTSLVRGIRDMRTLIDAGTLDTGTIDRGADFAAHDSETAGSADSGKEGQ